MGAIHNFLKRRGFVRLDHYGLILTPDSRILSNRPVLDDGLGGRIVGWLEGDLAAMELEHWEPAKRIGNPSAPVARPVPVVAPRPLPGVSPIATFAPPSIATFAPPLVAASPAVDEDDWEWEIAMARSRAAAEWIEEAGPAPKASTVIPVPTLPTVSDPRSVRPAQVARTPQPRRFPRATGRVDDTVRTQAAPANDDRTSPGVAMPPASGTQRAAAKHR